MRRTIYKSDDIQRYLSFCEKYKKAIKKRNAKEIIVYGLAVHSSKGLVPKSMYKFSKV
jgi:hypothetical protein